MIETSAHLLRNSSNSSSNLSLRSECVKVIMDSVSPRQRPVIILSGTFSLPKQQLISRIKEKGFLVEEIIRPHKKVQLTQSQIL